MDLNEALDIILEHEGGYVNDPNDPGGETKYGISKKQYPNVEIDRLTIEQARTIYETDYFRAYRLDEIESEFKYHVLDIVINTGNAKIFQKALNRCFSNKLACDGVIGLQTIGVANVVDPEHMNNWLYIERMKYYTDICKQNTALKKFMYNWSKRSLSWVY